MRKILAVVLATALTAGNAYAVDDCFDCVLGLFDDPALTASKGSINVGETKEIYVGVKLANAETSLSGVEFSIAGLNKDGLLVTGTEPLGPRALVWGNSVAAPPDTSATSSGDGGITAAWSLPRENGDALLKITLVATQEVSDRVLLVKRSYPTTNASWRTPIFTRADSPNFTAVRLSGGCYLLNGTGGIATGCASIMRVAVREETWSGVKRLFQ
jgi:hypothetical protein